MSLWPSESSCKQHCMGENWTGGISWSISASTGLLLWSSLLERSGNQYPMTELSCNTKPMFSGKT